MEIETKNGREIKKYHLNIGTYNTNQKLEIHETETEIYLISYESLILVYYKPLNLIIYDYETYKCSNTTRKHLREFIYYLNERGLKIKKEIYLSELEFYNGITKAYYDLNEISGRIEHYQKLAGLEKHHMQSLELEEIPKFQLENIMLTPDPFYYDGFEVKEKEIKELKTREKYYYLLSYTTNELYYKPFSIQYELIITTDKGKGIKGKQIINYRLKLLSKIGLTFNNYNTKELDCYTNYRY